MSKPASFGLFLGDLSLFCNEEDLRVAFQPYGHLVEVRIKRSKENKKNLSYGFVEYSTPIEAIRAMQAMDGKIFGGRALKVRWAAKKQGPGGRVSPTEKVPKDTPGTASIYVSFTCYNVMGDVTEETLREVFDKFGEVVDVTIKFSSYEEKAHLQKGYGFVSYREDQDGYTAVLAALNEMGNITLDNISYKCELSRASKQLLETHDMMPAAAAASTASLPVFSEVPSVLPGDRVQFQSEPTHTRRPAYSPANSERLSFEQQRPVGFPSSSKATSPTSVGYFAEELNFHNNNTRNSYSKAPYYPQTHQAQGSSMYGNNNGNFQMRKQSPSMQPPRAPYAHQQQQYGMTGFAREQQQQQYFAREHAMHQSMGFGEQDFMGGSMSQHNYSNGLMSGLDSPALQNSLLNLDSSLASSNMSLSMMLSGRDSGSSHSSFFSNNGGNGAVDLDQLGFLNLEELRL